VKTEEGESEFACADVADRAESETTSSQMSPRNRGTGTSEERLPHRHQLSVAAPPPANRQKTVASRKEEDAEVAIQRSAAPAAKRQKTTAPVDDKPKEKPSTAVGKKKKA
jgi:hypothetical protein